MRKQLLFCALLVMMAARGFSQTGVITGTVIDKDANPLELVTVATVETQKTVSTDKNGKFSIQAAPGQTIRFSFVGFTPQNFKVLTSTKKINITLQSNGTNLSEVIVTGLHIRT